MRPFVRTFLVPACVVAIGAAAIIWNVESKRTAERRSAEELRQYQSGANRGDANAEFELSDMYFRGRGVPQDDAQAAFWSQKAADQGFAKAEYAIGYLNYYGRGFDQSYANALVWYRKAADQDFSAAQYAIAGMYYHGFGVPQSYTDTLAWYEKAADRGYAKAESGIGYLYWNGLGVQKDHKEADRWYRRAAVHGDEDAQRWLGLRLYPLNQWGKIINTTSFVGGLLLISGLLSPRRLLRDQIQRKVVLAGVLCLLTVGLEVYAHSEYCLFPFARLALAFRFATLFLGGIVVTLLVTALRPRSGEALLILSGILLVLIDLGLCAIARFNMRFISSHVWHFVTVDAPPLGIAISAAVHLWRRQREPKDSATEPPAEGTGAESAV